jgi:type IV secretory pathway protease TraF
MNTIALLQKRCLAALVLSLVLISILILTFFISPNPVHVSTNSHPSQTVPLGLYNSLTVSHPGSDSYIGDE